MQGLIHLAYHGRFPSEKAAALFAARSVYAFQEIGISTILIAPRRFGRAAQSAEAYYALSAPITVRYLPTIDLLWLPGFRFVAFRISYVVFSLFVLLYAWRNMQQGDVFYTNEALPALAAALVGKRVVYELHDFPERSLSLYRAVFARAERIIATNSWKRDELVRAFGVQPEKIIVELNAVDLAQFDITESREDARRTLNLPENAKIILYTGHLYGWKGVDTLAETARRLPEERFYFVGGTAHDVASFTKKYKDIENIVVIGHRPHKEIPLWQRAADVLVLPNSGAEAISRHYTSPMKLFEYMASSTPIVASDLPSIREILPEAAGFYASPDDPESFAEAIRSAVTDSEQARARAKAARTSVAAHDWLARAQRIVGALV